MRPSQFLLFVCMMFSVSAFGQTQSHERIREIAKDFLALTVAELGEAASVEVANVDSRLQLNLCDIPEAFLPPGSKPWGKMTVGIRCTKPKAWQIYISANVKVTGSYYVAATNLVHGQLLTASDLVKVTGELSNLPSNAITNTQQVMGKIVQGSYSAGIALRSDMFRVIPVIQQGQTVKVISNGKGFSVSTEGTALSNANEGQITRVKTMNGQLVAGVAKLGGIIEIQN